MFCNRCGKDAGNAAFCPACGSPMRQQQPVTQQQPYNAVPNQQPNAYNAVPNQQPNTYNPQQNSYNNPNMLYQPMQPIQPMGWYKFLIYFALFAGCVLNVITGFVAITGSHYDGMANYVYRFFPAMQMLDIFYGIACIGVGVYGIVTRMALAKYNKNAPMMLYILYGVSAVIPLIYVFGASMVISKYGAIDFTSNIISVIGSAAMIAVNYVYFNKRKHLFVN